MAKAAAQGKGKARGKGGKTQRASSGGGMISSGNKMLLIFTGIALVPFSLPTILVLAFGMIPTMAAAVLPRGGVGKNAWMAVGGLNFAGLSPWLLTLWFGHHTLDYATEELLSVYPLLVAWLAAGAGWMLHLAMGPIVASYMVYTSQRRIGELVSEQRKLVDVWGEEVITKELPPLPAAPGNGGVGGGPPP